MAGKRLHWVKWMLLAVGLVPLAASHEGMPMQVPIATGQGQTAEFPMDRSMDRGRPDDVPFGNRELQARQLRRIREEHQKQVFADTARLLQLATTLKEQADKGTKPSPGTLKDVDEIAKLAKRLSERIKNQ